MKKLFTFLTILSLAFFSTTVKGQLVYHNAVTTANGDTSTALVAHVEIVNTSNAAIVVRIVRSNTNLSAGHDSYFCWGVTCYPPTTSLSSPFVLAAGDSSALLVYADANGSFGSDTVNCTVYDTAHANTDRVSINFTFDFATGIPVLTRPSPGYMNCYESNFDNATNISYSINNFKNGKIQVRNLLGSVVKEIMLSDKQGTLSVSTSEFPDGIYLYFLYNNDVPIVTRKMIVTNR